MGQYEYDLVNSADTLIFGRVTYQSFAGSWPHVPDNPSASEGEKEYARMLNSMRKIVFSKSLEKAEWNNSQLMRGILPEDIAKLPKEKNWDAVHQSIPPLDITKASSVSVKVSDEPAELIVTEGKPKLVAIKNIKLSVQICYSWIFAAVNFPSFDWRKQ